MLYNQYGEPFESGLSREEVQLRELSPRNELEAIIREAAETVEDELRLEDVGWVNFSTQTGAVVTDAHRVLNIKLSRLYYTKDPLGRQAIRLWTDYTFGRGITWNAEEETTSKALKAFWEAPANKSVLGARGQRMSSDKLLVDGEIFFALFLGPKGEVKIRRIDPLEIAEIITDIDDIEDVKYYRRHWTDGRNIAHIDFYRSTTNIKGDSAIDFSGQTVIQTQEALVYHLTYNTISQRGNPLLLPALDWIRSYRRFLASRVAVMLALARFAWKSKVKGGQVQVDAIKAKTDEQGIAAGSMIVENMGVDTQPIKTDTGAQKAYQDARMIKLQVCSAVGIPEQYFGDISIGNLATAKTVELPMVKMFGSYQATWDDAYQDIDEIVLEYNKVPPDKWYVDRDFPPIVPRDVAEAADAIVKLVGAFPVLKGSEDVQQLALLVVGVDDPKEVLDRLTDLEPEEGNREAKILQAVRELREAVKGNGIKEKV